MRRWIKIALALLIVLAVGLPFVPADLFRNRIQNALEQGLGRKVEIGEVHFTLFPSVLPGPGFTIDQVLIHEDPRAGIEPFAYVESLGASVRLLSLFSRRLEFSSLDVGDATVNMVQTASGAWNFQFLLSRAATDSRAMPSVRMRGGRVNFKFQDTKSTFYFNNADLDVQPSLDGSYEMRFGGAPSRTDRTAQEFGRLFVRGSSSAGRRMNFRVELERSELEGLLRWIVPGELGLHGTVSLDAQLSGTSSQLNVQGSLEVGDVHRWDLLPTDGSGLRMTYRGVLSLTSERLALASVASDPPSPFAIRFNAARWLTSPIWDAAVDLQKVPVENLLKIAQHMGAALPDDISAEGSISGTLSYSQANGLAGRCEFSEASLSLPEAEPLHASAAVVTIANGKAKLDRTTVHTGADQSADVEGTVSLAAPIDPAAPRDFDLRISTRGMDVAVMHSFSFASIPILRETPSGTWRGAAQYRSGEWSGDFELRKARFKVDGLAKPVEVESASVNLRGARATVNRLRATAGDIPFIGQYQYDPAAKFPHHFALSIPEADAAGLQKLLAPALQRESSFLSRTLRIGSAPSPPDWLKNRKADGTLSIESFNLAENRLGNLKTRLQWDGTQVRLLDLKAALDSGNISGELVADLARRTPRVRFEGELNDLGWRSGVISLNGILEGGNGGDFLDSLRAEGSFRARSIVFSSDAEFRTATGDFEMQGLGAQSKWKLSNVEVNQSGELFTGTGATLADGKLHLDLSSKVPARTLRPSATVFPTASQP